MGGGDHRQGLPERQAVPAAVGAPRAPRPGEPAACGPAELVVPVRLGPAAELVVAELVAVRVLAGEQPPPPGAEPGPAALGEVARERRRRRGGVVLVLVQEGRGAGGRAGAGGGGARRGRRRCVVLLLVASRTPFLGSFYRHS